MQGESGMLSQDSKVLCERMFHRNPISFVDLLLKQQVLSPVLDNIRDLCNTKSADPTCTPVPVECYIFTLACIDRMALAAAAAESTWYSDGGGMHHAALQRLFTAWLPQLHSAAGVTLDAMQPLPAASESRKEMELPVMLFHNLLCGLEEAGKKLVHGKKSFAFIAGDNVKLPKLQVSEGGTAVVISASFEAVCVWGKNSRVLLIGCQISRWGLRVEDGATCVLVGCVLGACKLVGCSVAQHSTLTAVSTIITECVGLHLEHSRAVLIASGIGPKGSGLVADNSVLEAIHLHIREQQNHGAVLSGSRTKARLTCTQAYLNGQDGVLVNAGASLELRDSFTENNGGSGITIDGSEDGKASSLMMQNSMSCENRTGIRALNGANCEVGKGCKVSGNKLAGVNAAGKGSAVVCHSLKCTKNKLGLRAVNGVKAAMHFCDITNNKDNGVHVEGNGAEVALSGGRIVSNGGSGVFCHDSKVEVTCRIVNNVRHGVEAVGTHADASCNRCTVNRNKGCGYVARDGASIVLINCTSKRNHGFGLAVEGRGSNAWTANYWSLDKQGKVSKQGGGEVAPYVRDLHQNNCIKWQRGGLALEIRRSLIHHNGPPRTECLYLHDWVRLFAAWLMRGSGVAAANIMVRKHVFADDVVMSTGNRELLRTCVAACDAVPDCINDPEFPIGIALHMHRLHRQSNAGIGM